jgi:hypothetical protein
VLRAHPSTALLLLACACARDCWFAPASSVVPQCATLPQIFHQYCICASHVLIMSM